MAVEVRLLGPDDRDALVAFLEAHADSSMFLRGNLARGGLVDRGEPFQATYAGAFDGTLRAVAAHTWIGHLLVQAPVHAAEVAREALARSGRVLKGINGPWAQVVEARRGLGLADRPAAFDSRDGLFALALSDLVRPSALDAAGVRCRRTADADLARIVRWRVAYSIELLNAPEGPALEAEARADVARHHGDGTAWVLERAGEPVAFSAFNARLPDVVQVGGVYTPPPERRRGYARAVVAGSLLAAAREGVRRAILFTGEDAVASRRAYEAIGFRRIGDYGLVIF
jgi:RimJ/RimL family protein N-acetyltransferase